MERIFNNGGNHTVDDVIEVTVDDVTVDVVIVVIVVLV